MAGRRFKRRSTRRYFGRARKGFHKKPTMSVAIVAGLTVPILQTYNSVKANGVTGFGRLSEVMVGYSPWSGQFNAQNLKLGLLPVVAGAAIHKAANFLGINRMIGQSGIPFFRI